MIEYKFPSNFIERFREYLSLEEYRDVDNHSKSDCWKHHAGSANIHISGNKITVGGEAGLYNPIEKNILKYMKRRILKFISDPFLLIPYIKRIIGISASEIKLLSYFDAFDKVMSCDPLSDPDLSPYRINFKRLKEKAGIIGSIGDMQRNYFAKNKYKITDHIVRTYYYYNILHGHMDLSRIKTTLEIGAGNGNLLSLLYKFTNNATIIDIDLPEILPYAILYISNLFPKAKILMPHEAKSNKFDHYKFVFLTPKQIHMIEDNSVDLAINTNSFQEIRHDQIEDYYQLIQRCGKNDSYFFTSNRVEKIPCSPDSYEKETFELPVRFSEYPWNPNNKTLIYEICKLTRLCQLDNVYIRLEQIQN